MLTARRQPTISGESAARRASSIAPRMPACQPRAEVSSRSLRVASVVRALVDDSPDRCEQVVIERSQRSANDDRPGVVEVDERRDDAANVLASPSDAVHDVSVAALCQADHI